MRRKVIAGNWKMNMTPSQAVKLVTELRPNVNNPDVDVVFCVPSIDIVPVVEAVKGSNIHIGAENVYYQEKGAFTGELSPEMLVDAGVSHVIIGHSERRMYFNESNTVLNLKMHKVLEHGIIPILCCGETLEQREKGITLDFVKEQIVEAYVGVTKEQVLLPRRLYQRNLYGVRLQIYIMSDTLQDLIMLSILVRQLITVRVIIILIQSHTMLLDRMYQTVLFL